MFWTITLMIFSSHPLTPPFHTPAPALSGWRLTLSSGVSECRTRRLSTSWCPKWKKTRSSRVTNRNPSSVPVQNSPTFFAKYFATENGCTSINASIHSLMTLSLTNIYAVYNWRHFSNLLGQCWIHEEMKKLFIFLLQSILADCLGSQIYWNSNSFKASLNTWNWESFQSPNGWKAYLDNSSGQQWCYKAYDNV